MNYRTGTISYTTIHYKTYTVSKATSKIITGQGYIPSELDFVPEGTYT